MRVIVLLVFFVGFQTAGFGQTNNADLKKAQKTLKNLLLGQSPRINEVKFDGCRMSLKSGPMQFWWPASSSNAEAGRTGSFNDDAKFSGGADTLLSDPPWDNYSIDLRILDTDKIKTTPVVRDKSLTLLDIVDSPDAVVTAVKPDPMRERFGQGIYRLTVKTKSLGKVQDAFRRIAEICSTHS